jgi:AcrR family transcriptional regulator
MSDEMSKRRYQMKKRAELQERTRLRITESAVELHGTLGPSRTSMTAVAEHAGVRRSTLYRHFPDETALFVACTAHWGEANPQPDLERWAAIDDPEARLHAALEELYAYYSRTESMFANILRDESTMPTVARMLTYYRDYLARARDTLLAGRRERGHARRRVRAALGHALAFSTWQSLTREEGLSDGDAVALICSLVASGASLDRGSRLKEPNRPADTTRTSFT